MPTSPDQSAQPQTVTGPQRRPLLPRTLWWWIAGAFVLGLLLFAMLWWDQRNDGDFFKVDGTATGSADLPPLPAPLPDDVMVELPAVLSGGQTPLPEDAQQPHIVEPAAPPPAPLPPPASAPPQVAASPTTAPVPISTPAPAYPRNAQRRGIGGTAVIRVDVTGRGLVESMELERSSGDRELDRAALTAVRRWRFQPATRDGREVAASVRVPITFNPDN